MKTYLTITLWLTCACAALGRSYDGYEVLRLTPSHDEHRQWLRELEHSLGDMLDFWSDVKQIDGSTVDMMVPPALQADIRDTLDAKGLKFTVMTADVGATLASQEQERFQRRASQPSIQSLSDFDYSVYHTYEEIQQWVNDVVAEYPGLVERFELPSESYEGRIISGLKISSGGGDSKPAVYFEGGIHAREWISPATVMYMTANLLSGYASAANPDIQNLINKLDWYIVPSLNVDGYVYTWTDDRLWRKTRSSNVEDTGSGCMGTDPNRNWPYEWGGEGTSAFPCSNVYRGKEALCEQEVEAVVDFLREEKAAGHDFIWFIDWHSYSQLIISPWSFSAEEDDPLDMVDQLAAGDEMASAILATHGKTYQVGPTAKLLYAAAGASNDWGYAPYDSEKKMIGGLGAKYSYVVELRDTGDYGFLLPADQIVETAEESFAGMIAMGSYILAQEQI